MLRLRAGLLTVTLAICTWLVPVVGIPESDVQQVAASSQLPALTLPYPGLDEDGPESIAEVQAWWVPNFGHIHARAVLPFGRSVRGMLTVPMQAIIHNNPSRLTRVQLVMRDGLADDQPVIAGPIENLSDVCPYNGTGDSECSHHWTFHVDTTKYHDGWKRFYLWVETQTPDGKAFRTSSRIPVKFANGNTSNGDSGSDYLADLAGCPNTSFLSRAWYDDFGPNNDGAYADARALCVPQHAVSGTMDLIVGGGRSTSAQHLTINVTKTHALPSDGPWSSQVALAGKTIFDQDGSFESPFHIKLDTRLLANGMHTIDTQVTHPGTAISVCSYCRGEQNQLRGVARAYFWVNNSGATPTKTPTKAPTRTPAPDNNSE